METHSHASLNVSNIHRRALYPFLAANLRISDDVKLTKYTLQHICSKKIVETKEGNHIYSHKRKHKNLLKTHVL